MKEQSILIKTPISRDDLDTVIEGLEIACGGNRILVTDAFELVVQDKRQAAALKALFGSNPNPLLWKQSRTKRLSLMKAVFLWKPNIRTMRKGMNNLLPTVELAPHPEVGMLIMTENVTLPNGLHRIRFRQTGRIPDLEVLLEQYGSKDGQHIYCTAWMDRNGIGHAYIAFKEWMINELPGLDGKGK